MRLFRSFLTLSGLLAACFWLPGGLHRAIGVSPGDLDPTFNGTGQVMTGIGYGNDYGRSIVLQSDGKILVAGSAYLNGYDNFAIVRYRADGSLDTGFGTAGKVTTSFGASSDTAQSVAVQGDGKIVVVGNIYYGSAAIIRYNSNGTLDTSFGGTGQVTVSSYWYNSVAIQADGKLVVAGTYNGDIAVIRYNSNGTLDTTFGGTGKVTTNIGSSSDEANCVVVQSDGKILVAGDSYQSSTDFALVRYNSNGSIDASFGIAGVVITAFGTGTSSSDIAYSIALQADGKIVAAGSSSSNDVALARYNTDGSLDTSFGGTGKVTTSISTYYTDYARGVALQADGKIMVAGYTPSNVSYLNQFALLRYNTDGSLDATFGSSGKVLTSFGGNGDQAYALAVQADGKLVVAGNASNGSNADFALARYEVVDTETRPPILTAPALNLVTKTPVAVAFTLPEPALAGSVRLTFFDGTNANVLTLASSQETLGTHSFSLDVMNPTASAQVASGSPIPSGVYTVTLSYQDTLGHPAASFSASNVTIDTATLPPTLTSPATATVSRNPISVSFVLPEAALSSSLKLTFAGTVTRALTLAPAQLTAGPHTFVFDPAFPTGTGAIVSGSSIPDGAYAVTLSYQDAVGNAAVTSVAAMGVVIDTVTSAPTVTTPAASSKNGNPFPVSFSLPEAALPGSVKLTFAGLTTTQLVLASTEETAGAHTFSFDPAQPTSSASITSGGPIPDGSYTVTFSYQDSLGNAVVSTSRTSVVVDTVTLVPTITFPAAGSFTRSPIPVSFNLPEAAASASVTLTFTGPVNRQLILDASQQTAGAHNFSFDPKNPTGTGQIAAGLPIPDGTYTVTLAYQDNVGNAMAAATQPNVTIDTVTTLPTLLAPFTGAIAGKSLAVSFVLPEQAMRSSLKLTFLGAVTRQLTLAGTQETPGPHSFAVKMADPMASAQIGSGASIPDGTYTVTLSYQDYLGNTEAGIAVSDVTLRTEPGGDHTVFYSENDPVPGAGLPGGPSAGAVFTSFGVPAINDAGQIAFLARWSSAIGESAGIFAGSPPALVAQLGDTAPGLDSAGFQSFADPMLDDAGHVAFLATVDGAAVNKVRRSVLVTNAFDGTLAVVAREGGSVNEPDGALIRTLNDVSLVHGELLFTATLASGAIGSPSTYDPAAFRIANVADGLQRIVRKGEMIGARKVTAFRLLAVAAGSPAQNRAHRVGSATFLVLFSDGTQALVDSMSGTTTDFVATGDVTGGTQLPDAAFKNFGLVAADANRTAFLASLKIGIGGVTHADSRGVFIGVDNAFEPVARVSEPVSGLPGAVFKKFLDPVLAPGNAGLAFPGMIQGVGVDATNDGALFYRLDGGVLHAIAREGGQPPGTAPGTKWKSFVSLALPGGSGGPIFHATLLPGAGGVTRANDEGVWAIDSGGALRLVFRKGDPVNGQTIKRFTVLNAVRGGVGATRAFNNAAQIVWRATFAGGSTAVIVTKIP